MLYEIIQTALCDLRSFSCYSCLVQFWAPKMIRNRCVLTTYDQPFAIHNIPDGSNVIGYRKHCMSYNFAPEVDIGSGLITGGLPYRVFCNRLPEMTPNLRYYSVEEYPLRDMAVNCGMNSSFGMPVFEQSNGHCIGVLEFVSTADWITHHVFQDVGRVLEVAGLRSIRTYPFARQIKVDLESLTKQIEIGLTVVSKAYGLSLAQTWGQCGLSIDFVYNGCRDGSSMVELSALLPWVGYFECHQSSDFHDSCLELPLRRGWGMVGKTLLSRKSCFCTDVSQLGISEYPPTHLARKYQLSGCLTILLRSDDFLNHQFVLEIFLPRGKTDIQDLPTLLRSILATVKQQFGSFQVASGKDVENELFIEIDKFSVNCESAYSLNSFLNSTTTILESRALQNKGEDFPHNVGSVVGPGPIEIDAAALEETPESNNHPNTGYQKTENLISYETIRQQFGKRLEDAAECIGVSRSTLKRWCRQHQIHRWPHPKRQKAKNRVKRVAGSQEQGAYLLHRRPTALIPQQSTRDSNSVTVKATCNDDIIKFQLSFSSGMADLMERVTMRLKLPDGSFSIKYQDDDGDYILLACDEDLQDCLSSERVKSEKASIKMLVQLMQNISYAGI